MLSHVIVHVAQDSRDNLPVILVATQWLENENLS